MKTVNAYAAKLERTEGGISCPACGLSTAVGDSRPHAGNAIKRRRYCKCGFRFTTFEHAIDEAPQFVEMLDSIGAALKGAFDAVVAANKELDRVKFASAVLRELSETRYGAAKPLTPPIKD